MGLGLLFLALVICGPPSGLIFEVNSPFEIAVILADLKIFMIGKNRSSEFRTEIAPIVGAAGRRIAGSRRF